jgi:hypothetical protein
MSPGRATGVAAVGDAWRMHHLDCSCEPATTMLDEQAPAPSDRLVVIGPGCQHARRARFVALYRHLAETALALEAARPRPPRRRARRPRIIAVSIPSLD